MANQAQFNPVKHPGKLHREMGIPTSEKIPADKLRAATHSSDPEKRRDAIRAETMKKWHHGGAHTRTGHEAQFAHHPPHRGHAHGAE